MGQDFLTVSLQWLWSLKKGVGADRWCVWVVNFIGGKMTHGISKKRALMPTEFKQGVKSKYLSENHYYY